MTTVATVLALGMLTGIIAPVLPPSVQPAVTVTEDHGVYSVTARFVVPEPPAAVLAVLTDYEQIPQFMPGITRSVVLSRTPGRAVVEQEAVSSVLTFSKRMHLVLEIEEGSGTLQFHDRCGRSFVRYEGRWRATERDGATEVVYELVARPSFSVPEFVLKRVLKRDSTRMIEQLRQRIALGRSHLVSTAKRPAAWQAVSR